MKQGADVAVGGLLVTLLVATPLAGGGEDPGAPGGEPAPSCTTSGCHLPIGQFQRLHEPVATNRCDACHKPKRGGTPFQAGLRHEFERAGDNPELCYACHDRLARDGYVHEPVKMGVCILCHDPHGSEHKLLLRVGTDGQLCAQCHRVTFDQGKHVHPPVSAGTCGACHNPHGSDHKKFLRAAPPELCLDCHDTIKELLEEAAVTHGAVTTGRSCLNCHDPHSSNVERLLVGKPMELCLSCHESEMVEVERDEEVTEFRNGDLNLHYVHVHREKEGTSCSACHDVHAGKNPKHIVGPAPSREGAVPMVYKPSETGGSCQSGCHKMWAYDRVQAVQNE